MSWIAGIDVHKRILALVIGAVEVEGEYQFERRGFASNLEQLRVLAQWLLEQQVEEVVMESPLYPDIGGRKPFKAA